MSLFVLLYLQTPYWPWLGVASGFVILSLVTGIRAMIWPTLAALLVAAVSVPGVHPPPPFDVALFVALTTTILTIRRNRVAAETRRQEAEAQAQLARIARQRPDIMPSARTRRGKGPLIQRLTGQIGRTSTEFASGRGHVWINDGVYLAELESETGELPPDTLVRVTGVLDGARLQIRALNR
jgi:membrane protein implicated in regulation of membrane protease activity